MFLIMQQKADLKNKTGIDTLKFSKKVDLANLKSDVNTLVVDKLVNVISNLSNLKNKVDKLEDDKLVPVPADLSDVVKTMSLKKMYIMLMYLKIKDIEDKIPDITNLATNTTLNVKTIEVKNKIPSITNLAITNALNPEVKINEVKNKTPNITNLAMAAALTAGKKKYLMLVI